MNVSGIIEQSGSALTFYCFTIMDVTEEFSTQASGEGYYWVPVKETRQLDTLKPPVDVTTGIKMAFRNRGDAEHIRNEILNSGQ